LVTSLCLRALVVKHFLTSFGVLGG